MTEKFAVFTGEHDLYKSGDIFYIKSCEKLVSDIGSLEDIICLTDISGVNMFVTQSYYQNNFEKVING